MYSVSFLPSVLVHDDYYYFACPAMHLYSPPPPYLRRLRTAVTEGVGLTSENDLDSCKGRLTPGLSVLEISLCAFHVSSTNTVYCSVLANPFYEGDYIHCIPSKTRLTRRDGRLEAMGQNNKDVTHGCVVYTNT